MVKKTAGWKWTRTLLEYERELAVLLIFLEKIICGQYYLDSGVLTNLNSKIKAFFSLTFSKNLVCEVLSWVSNNIMFIVNIMITKVFQTFKIVANSKLGHIPSRFFSHYPKWSIKFIFICNREEEQLSGKRFWTSMVWTFLYSWQLSFSGWKILLLF